MSPSPGKAFARVYDENVDRVYGFFGYLVSSPAEAERLTRQTFERALGAWEDLDVRRASVAAWLIGIATDLLADRDSPGRPGEIPAEGAGRRCLSPELDSALGMLTERERELIALRFGGGLGGAELAELTGLDGAEVGEAVSGALQELWAALGGVSAQPAASGPAPSTPSAAIERSTRPEIA